MYSGTPLQQTGFQTQRSFDKEMEDETLKVFQGWVNQKQRMLDLSGQTLKQPVVWRCINPMCVPPGERYFEFTSDHDRCPKCTMGPPCVYKKALIHMMIQDPKGPIRGDLGIRYRIVCDPKRTYLATAKNGEAVTVDTNAINCPGCIKTLQEYADRIKGSGFFLKLRKQGQSR